MRKKIIAALLTAALTVSMAMSAFAATYTGYYVCGANGGYNSDGSDTEISCYNLAWNNNKGDWTAWDGSTSPIYIGLKATELGDYVTYGDPDATGKAQAYLAVNVTVETAGTYTFTVALTGSGDRGFKYNVNGGSFSDVSVTCTGWDPSANIINQELTVTLKAGTNVLIFAQMDDGTKTPNVYGFAWTLVEAETTTTTAASTETTASAGSDSTETTAAASSTTTVAGGDESTTVAMVVIALVAVGAVVASKRKSVTE